MTLPDLYTKYVKLETRGVEERYEKASKRKNSKAEPPKFITRLQGKAKSDTLIVAPVPTDAEFTNNLAWCSPAAVAFFRFLAQCNCKYDHSDYLIAPCLFTGNKPAKGNHEPISELVESAVSSNQIKRFIVVGGVPFRLHFGKGKSVDPSVGSGVVLYPDLLKGKPLYMFPDFKPFSYTDDYIESLNYFGKNAIERDRLKLTMLMEQECLPGFDAFMATEREL